jgi:threonine-phosphate decarboxylase
MQRLNCDKFPCHGLDQDCSLCFCPFYPCGDGRTGGRMEAGVWSCRSCRIIHRPEVAAMVMDCLMRGETLVETWKKLEEKI